MSIAKDFSEKTSSNRKQWWITSQFKVSQNLSHTGNVGLTLAWEVRTHYKKYINIMILHVPYSYMRPASHKAHRSHSMYQLSSRKKTTLPIPKFACWVFLADIKLEYLQTKIYTVKNALLRMSILSVHNDQISK